MIEHYLCWADVDPRGRPPLDLARVAEIVQPIAVAGGESRPETFSRMQAALLAEYGVWIDGWAWGATSGGPVRAWCCVTHNILPDEERRAAMHPGRTPVEATVDGVLAAVADWRRCLDELSARFDELAATLGGTTPAGAMLADAIEYAASELLPYVVDRTATEDAWYQTFEAFLAWYAESLGVDPALARETIADTIDGKFESWGAPADDVARDTAAALGRAIATLDEKPVVDALHTWRTIRSAPFAATPPQSRAPVLIDGHQTFIDTADRDRDPERADRLAAALVLCRDSARRGMALTIDQLAEWQAVVLGVSRAALRTGVAGRGHERYGMFPKIWSELESHFAQASRPHGPVGLRAARVYLDVCFFHPFDDGNARAARLALDHVLTRAGLAISAAAPLFVVARSAGHTNVLRSLTYVVDQLIAPIGF